MLYNRKAPKLLILRCFILSDPGEARTLDPMIKSHLLYQLSYGVSFVGCKGNCLQTIEQIICRKFF